VPGDVIDDQCLQDMALAGGASPNYHWATTPAMLTDVVVGIVRSVATEACRLELGDPIDDFNQVGLFLNNVLVPRGEPMAGSTGIVSPSSCVGRRARRCSTIRGVGFLGRLQLHAAPVNGAALATSYWFLVSRRPS
jgi:hypothetical protein